MPRYRNLSDAALIHRFDTVHSNEDAAAADVLECIVDFEERKLWVAAGYPSLLDYCVGKLRRTRDSARKRIHAAHTAQRFPMIFSLVAQGRLHLSAVVLLAPYLTPENANELFAAAAHKSKDEIRQLLHHQFAQPSQPSLDDNIESPTGSTTELEVMDSLAPSLPPPAVPCAPGRTEMSQLVVTTTPVVLDSEMTRLVGRAQELLGYELRSDDPKEVLRRALRVLVGQLEKRIARKPRPCPSRRATAPHRADPAQPSARETERRIPNMVKSAVWQRDKGRCTFVGESGHACESRRRLEFDHIVPVARGGESTVSNVRLRCRAHNQLEAERTFGSEFMEGKREAARTRAARAANGTQSGAGVVPTDELDVIPWLRQLGYRTDQAKRAAAHCERLGGATLEERVRAALRFLAPPHRKILPNGAIA
jgi:5-methylcytosine-specific restriction endonuclease McrA